MITAHNERSDLALRIVHGALEDDLVQMHGAIVATLELYQIHEAECLRRGGLTGRRPAACLGPSGRRIPVTG